MRSITERNHISDRLSRSEDVPYLEAMVGQSILVVSQDASRARLLEDALQHGGFTVVAATDPAQPSTQLVNNDLAAVVVDLSLPGLDRPALASSLSPTTPTLQPEPLEAVERRHILATLQFTGWNKRRAALILGIARSTLIQKVRRYKLKAPGAPVR
jgi:DNA-binding NtrC family response regulator